MPNVPEFGYLPFDRYVIVSDAQYLNLMSLTDNPSLLSQGKMGFHISFIQSTTEEGISGAMDKTGPPRTAGMDSTICLHLC
jgi:hypothetical protein